MSRRSMARRLEGIEGRLGTGGRMFKEEFHKQARGGTLIRLPGSDDGDDGEADRTIRVVFVHAEPDGERLPLRGADDEDRGM